MHGDTGAREEVWTTGTFNNTGRVDATDQRTSPTDPAARRGDHNVFEIHAGILNPHQNVIVGLGNRVDIFNTAVQFIVEFSYNKRFHAIRLRSVLLGWGSRTLPS